MEVNSTHQRWSRWRFDVRPAGTTTPTWADVRTQAARFARSVFGSAGQMQVTHDRAGWHLDCRVEGPPVHDPDYRRALCRAWVRFLGEGFGVGARIHCEAWLEAGDRQDGRPPDQLVILPASRDLLAAGGL